MCKNSDSALRQIVVIIPVYNCVDFLQAAVMSVRDQPYGSSQIILVNDGSTDGSAALCDHLAATDDRIIVIHKENGGVSSARNRGIEYAIQHIHDGFVVFLDADDFWCVNAITHQVFETIQREHNTDIFAFGGFRSNPEMTRFSKPYGYSDQILSGGNSALWKLKGQFVANFYSIEMLKKWNIRFNEKLKYSEDVIFRQQCSFFSRKIHFLPLFLYCYRENPHSAMSKVLSIRPIDYYTSIIDGWIESDTFINSYREQTGTTCKAGHILAGIYFMDMAADHFKRGFRKKELQHVWDTHPHFDTFLNMHPNTVSETQFKNHELLINNPTLFLIKWRILGVAEYIIRAFFTTKPGRHIRNRFRYPLTKIPVNGPHR